MRRLLSFKLAIHHLAANARRLAVTIVAVGIGVGLVVAVRLMNASVLASFLGTIDVLAGRASLTVTAGEGFTFAEDVAERVGTVPGVRLAVPLVRSIAFPDDDSGELLTVLGVDLTHEAAVRVYDDVERAEDVVDDLVVFLSQPDSIIAGRTWALQRGLTVGSRLPLVTPTGVRTFTVRGLIEPRGLGRVLAGRLIIMDVYAAERAFTTDGQVNQIDVVLTSDADAARVRSAVAAVLPAGLVVQEPAVRRDVIRTSVAGFQAMLTAFALLAVLAGIVICYSRLRTLFEARTWEVGLLRTLGLRQSVVFIELVKEGFLLGLAGVGLGIPLGIAVAHCALPYMAAATAINFRLPVPVATQRIDAGAIAMGAAVGVLAAIMAAVMPALRLSRTQPVAALRLRGREAPRFGSSIGIGLAALFLAASVGMVVWQHVAQTAKLGGVATALFTLGLLGFAGPLVVYSHPLLTRVLSRLFGPTGRSAADHLSQQGRRASLAVATLGLGLGSVLLFGILGWSFERSLVAQLTARFRAQLIVNSAFVAGGWMAAPLREDVIHEIEEVPGVALASGQHLTEIPYAGGSVSLFSYDRPCFRDLRVCQWPLLPGAIPDALDHVGDGDAVIVSTSFAREQGIRPGDSVSLGSPAGPQRFLIAGIAREEPAHAVIMSRERYERAWNDRMVTWIHVVLDGTAGQDVVAREVAHRLGKAHRIQVRRVDEFLAFLAAQARQAFNLLYIMEAMTLLLVLIGVADALAAGVLERIRQFGVMRAIGLRRSQLSAMVVLDGAAIGLLGLVIATAAGFGLSLFWVYVQFPALLGWNLDYSVPVGFVGVAMALAMLLSLIGTIAPAIHVSSLSLPEALRNE